MFGHTKQICYIHVQGHNLSLKPSEAKTRGCTTYSMKQPCFGIYFSGLKNEASLFETMGVKQDCFSFHFLLVSAGKRVAFSGSMVDISAKGIFHELYCSYLMFMRQNCWDNKSAEYDRNGSQTVANISGTHSPLVCYPTKKSVRAKLCPYLYTYIVRKGGNLPKLVESSKQFWYAFPRKLFFLTKAKCSVKKNPLAKIQMQQGCLRPTCVSNSFATF